MTSQSKTIEVHVTLIVLLSSTDITETCSELKLVVSCCPADF